LSESFAASAELFSFQFFYFSALLPESLQDGRSFGAIFLSLPIK